MKYTLTIILACLLLVSVAQADLEEGEKVPNPTLRSVADKSETTLHELLNTVTVLHLWKCNWLQCRAEIPHIKEIIPDFKDQPVSFLSVNTRNPDGQVKAEVKKYKIDYPVFFGKGQDINKNFKVKILPRLILIKEDGTIYKDLQFLEAAELKAEIQKLLSESSTSTGEKKNTDTGDK